jgi:Spy/CpxP family protein refolding chaperone
MIKPFFAIIASSLFLASSALAQDPSLDREAAAADMQQRREEIAERLNLTEEQKVKIDPILRESAKQRQAIMAKYGVTGEGRPNMSFRKMRKMRGEMNDLTDDTKKNLSGILTDEQMDEYETIQDEQRSAMRERMKKR